MSTSTHSSPPELPAADDRLATAQAFRRFVARVSSCAGRWLAFRGVHEADHDDVLQDALVQMYKRRESYDPGLSTWESWAFGFVGRAALKYHTKRRTRLKHMDVAPDVLPDIAADSPSPEEEAEAVMMHALLKRCLATLDDESRAILHANAEGIEMTDIAAALGLSRTTAYERLRTARAQLQAALDREQRRKRALGVMVLPLTIDQLLASDTTTTHFSEETMRRIWKTLDRVMSADLAAGRLRDDATDVERYMGSPNPAPRARGARTLRAVGPRALSALTHVAAAAVGAGVVYALMRHGPTPADPTAGGRAAASSLAAHIEYPREPAPTKAAARSAAPSAGAAQEPELRADAGAAPRTDAGSGPSAVGRGDTSGEQLLFDLGSTAFQRGYYEVAIKVFREHAIKYPRCRYSAPRERLFSLALIHAGRKAEARQQIERLRQASPGSALLAELDVAMNASDP